LHGDGITTEVQNAEDQKGRQHIFKYLLMAEPECSSVGFTKKKIQLWLYQRLSSADT
jgi:hypothetical protein